MICNSGTLAGQHTCPKEINRVGQRRETERLLDTLNRSGIAALEDPVQLGDRCLHIRRAVLRHVLADRLEVFPEVSTVTCQQQRH